MNPADDRTADVSHAAGADNTASLGGTGPGGPAAAATPDRLGKYRVLGVLGRGGMGVVYRAEDPVLRRTVALKVLPARAAADPVARERFLREARAQAAVEHDHVVAIYEVVDDAAVPFLAMPVLRGLTLADALRANPQPPLAESLRIAREAAEGLAAAHATGLVHRDVKPGNIWLEEGRLRVKLLDFGLARAAGDLDPVSGESVAADAHLTRTGAVVGTPAYMSPEQALGRPLDHRTDLFSLGVVLYQMVAGRPPFPGATAADVMAAVVRVEPLPLGELVPGVPPALADLVGRLLAKTPASRPPSAAAVASELAAIEKGLTGTHLAAAEPWGDLTDDTQTLTEARPAVRRRGSRWVPVALGVLGFGVVAAAVAALMWGWSATETAYLDIDDAGAEAVELTLKRDGVPVAERTRERKFALPPGVYTVEVSAPDPAVKLSGGLVTLDSGGREKLTLRVNQRTVVAPKLDDYNPDDPEWLKLFLKQPPKVQVARFTKELQRLNPDFDGKVEFEEEGGKVVELRLRTDRVSDMSPIRVLRELRTLNMGMTPVNLARFTDLSPLRGIKLSRVIFGENSPPAKNIEALRGMPLVAIGTLQLAKAEDIKLLRGMSIHELYLYCPNSGEIDCADLKECVGDGAYLLVPRCKLRNLAGLAGRSLSLLAGPPEVFDDPYAAELRAHDVASWTYEAVAQHGRYLRRNPHVKMISGTPAPVFWASLDLSPRPLAPTWHVLGPWKSNEDDPLDPAADGGRLTLDYLAAPVARAGDSPLRWKQVAHDRHDGVDFGAVVGRDEKALAWLHTVFTEGEPGRAVLFVTGAPAYRVWLNGAPVVIKPDRAGPGARRAVVVELRAGENFITARSAIADNPSYASLAFHLHRLRPGEAPPAGIDPPAPPPK